MAPLLRLALLLALAGGLALAQDTRPGRRPRLRAKVALPGQGDQVEEGTARGAGRRPGGRQLPARGRHRMRGGGRRFPGRPRRPPLDYYQDYYGDQYYYYDDEYYQYEDEEEEPETVEPTKAATKEKSKKCPDADIGEEDYAGLIRQLWCEFLEKKEKENTPDSPPAGQAGQLADKEPVEPARPACEPLSDVSYYLPDEVQCDKYLECNIKGEIREHLCPDGFTFDITLEKCDYPVKVNCTGRPNLQEPHPSTNCSRANGFFPWPAEVSCQNFWDCREGTAYLQSCPVGVIFDPAKNTCATPDQSSRTECTQGVNSFLGFSCPQYTPESVLQFGNHDRLPNPEDCHTYFTCLRTGGPRLATCPRKKVFNPTIGQCGDPKNVEGCETWWIDRLKEEEDSEYYYDDY